MIDGSKLDRELVLNLIQREGRTRAWVAAQCEISTHYLTMILGGHRNPSGSVFKLLAQCLQTTVVDLTKRSKAS